MNAICWKQGMINPENGLVFWCKQKSCKDGLRWVTLKKYRLKRIAISKRQASTSVKDRNKKIRNCAAERHKRNVYAQTLRKTKEQKEKAAAYARKRRAESPIISLQERIRARIRESIRIKNISKKSSTYKILGCDWPYFKSYIESKFQKGMTWDNRSDWELDHIIPLSAANSETELISLFHYTNIQPLWTIQNRIKGSRIIAQLSKENKELKRELSVFKDWRIIG